MAGLSSVMSQWLFDHWSLRTGHCQLATLAQETCCDDVAHELVMRSRSARWVKAIAMGEGDGDADGDGAGDGDGDGDATW